MLLGLTVYHGSSDTSYQLGPLWLFPWYSEEHFIEEKRQQIRCFKGTTMQVHTILHVEIHLNVVLLITRYGLWLLYGDLYSNMVLLWRLYVINDESG